MTVKGGIEETPKADKIAVATISPQPHASAKSPAQNWDCVATIHGLTDLGPKARQYMSKLFLHIGPHKTGSTYIQKYCLEHRDHLASLGVNYPNVGLLGTFGQHETIRMVKTAEQRELGDYLAQFLVSRINLVSSENFDRLNLTDLQKFKASLATIDPLIEVKIIYYYRSYVDLLPSWWQENVKNGSRTPFFEFAFPHILRPFSSNIINPATVLDLYAKVFGKERIVIVGYDAAVENGNILAPIFELLGIKLGPAKNEIINPSAKLEIVELIRALNIIAHSRNRSITDEIRQLFLRGKKDSAISADREHLAALIRDQMKPLKLAGGFFEKSVSTEFKKKYGSCFFNEVLSESRDAAVSVPSANWMFTENTFEACERIFQFITTSNQSSESSNARNG